MWSKHEQCKVANVCKFLVNNQVFHNGYGCIYSTLLKHSCIVYLRANTTAVHVNMLSFYDMMMCSKTILWKLHGDYFYESNKSTTFVNNIVLLCICGKTHKH